jgi:peptidoglycan/LPS O-acetylase OafA/YrhL
LWKYFLFGILASEISEKLKPAALPLFILGAGLIGYDMRGYDMNTDWVSATGLVPALPNNGGETFGLGIGCMLVLATTPHLRRFSRALNVLPLRLLGTISYSVYIIHPFYIAANFPAVGRLSGAHDVSPFMKMAQMPDWYLPVLFLPGILFWGLVSFLLVERPGMRFGQYVINRTRTVMPLDAVTPRP